MTRQASPTRPKRWFAGTVLALCLAGCASGFKPKTIDQVPFRDRSVTQVENGIRVTTAVPDAGETRDLFGISLYRKRIQPVWIEIENMTAEDIWFLPFGVDSDYHTPMEVAALTRKSSARQQAEQHFLRNGVNLGIRPGETRSGFVFTELDQGTKAFNVDVFNDDDTWQFTFFVPVPGLATDHGNVDFKSLYADDQISHYTDAAEFIRALQQLPCCVKDSKGENFGDPLNLVIIGEPLDIYYAVIRADWDETEVVSAASGLRTAMSFLTGGKYRYSPVSSLYVFGRRQDIALQRIRENINERNHFRLWLAPMTFQGQSVWIGQISRDIGVRFTTKTITTHKIDPDVDETREFLIENLAYNQVLSRFAYVGGVGAAPIESPRGNLTGDPYFTDGLRAVMWIPAKPTDLQDIRYVDWSDPEG
ncbi:MAG: LssY C-terminal domain-containing protein [Gammaproteobacteria bacterium]|nr:LssY C-terminal domain-containing protein [Gammaproteobacteria bacterium]MDH4314078.1 LssY C-terminal domain-containing protein [Gammaproteobacteria bacterium]MDH5213121.1 LssY C-terminal domain-containing protein [Gammaproteobacteria bacterium]MDH5500414.1 LssY C-terminal domain-containing protein [Gammaproteobacteria bacterium]